MEKLYHWFQELLGGYFLQIEYTSDLGVRMSEITTNYSSFRGILYGAILVGLFIASGSFNDSKRNPIRLVMYAGLIDGIGVLVLYYLNDKLEWSGLGMQLDWLPRPANNMISLMLLILVIRSAYIGKPLRSAFFVAATYMAFPLMLRYLILAYWKFYIFPATIMVVGMMVITRMKRFSISWIVGYFFHLLAHSSVCLMMQDYMNVDYLRFMASYRMDFQIFLGVLALTLIYEYAVIDQTKPKTASP